MEVMEAIKERRSIRSYDAASISDELLQRVLEAGRLAPSSSNVQSWKFRVVTDRDLKSALRKAAMNQSFIEEAPVVIVACLDLEAFGERTKGIVASLKNREANMAAKPGLFRYCEGDDEERCAIHAFMNISIAVENMALEATSLGMGTCWVRAFDPDQVARILAIPPQYPPAVLLPLGFPAETPPPRPRRAMREILL